MLVYGVPMSPARWRDVTPRVSGTRSLVWEGSITASVPAEDGMVFVPTGAPELFRRIAAGQNTMTAYALSDRAHPR